MQNKWEQRQAEQPFSVEILAGITELKSNEDM
jgi:hypothetical protein